MPYISSFLYAEDSVQLPGQPLNIVNPQIVLRPMFVPGMFSFTIVFGISEVVVTEAHTLRCIFCGPEGEVVLDTGAFDVPVQPDAIKRKDDPIETQALMVNMNFRNVPFKCEGRYNTQVFLDGTNIGNVPVMVRGNERAFGK
ncbi:hypothetical protein GTO91_12730 [Heliobacterium undosum]|uniref:Uncharacterized protein n=1 Tax=Heliomicrobium undosum TaxID=121734 RepID=A0A845L5S4_9FIRM|nr:hypothetical protein [Heliomicrobium undosum]MZP30579.1 hypothetical protein [Heliomicrobium undosum]